MALKIAFIGAGSIGFTRGLLRDLLSVPEFADAEIAFTDINPRNLDMVTRLCQRDIEENGLSIRIRSTLDRREAFAGAKYVINCVRIGMLEAFRKDVEIPLKYGVDQCVGDTLCVGGIFYAQRDIAALEGFCRDIREVALPGCMMLNYSNPNAMVTWYCNKYGGVPTVGLCHGVQGGHALIARALGYRQEEIDIVGSDAEWALFGECKWKSGKIAQGELEKLQRRSMLLLRDKKREYYLFSRSGFTGGLEKQAKQAGNTTLVGLEDLLREV